MVLLRYRRGAGKEVKEKLKTNEYIKISWRKSMVLHWNSKRLYFNHRNTDAAKDK